MLGSLPAGQSGCEELVRVLAGELARNIARGRSELDVDGRVDAATWAAIDDVVDELMAALPTRGAWPPRRPLTDGNHPKVAPAAVRPGEHRPERG